MTQAAQDATRALPRRPPEPYWVWTAEALIFLLPLACWPNLERPFTTPKIFVLSALALAAAARFLARGSRPGGGWLWLAWPAALALSALLAPSASPEALLLAALPLPLCWAIREGYLPPESVRRPLLISSLIVSAVLLLQYFNADPLRLLGWRPEVSGAGRMRMYGTFGNPNFAAAWLSATLPLYAGAAMRRKALPIAAAGVQIAAIAATGSRAPVLGIAAAAIIFAPAGRHFGKWALAAAPLAAALLWLSPARPLGDTIEGRLYYVRVASPHLLTAPPVGYGPGMFADRFDKWQAEWLNNGGSDRFAGPLDHAHNDYVEFWVEYGAAGLIALLGPLAWLAWKARRHGAGPAAIETSAWAGIAALWAVAVVDFPLHRPPEWTLYWLLLGIVALNRRKQDVQFS